MSENCTLSSSFFIDNNNTCPTLQNINTTPAPFDFYTSTLLSYQGTKDSRRLVSPEVADEIYWYFNQVVNPLVGIIGILGSLASVIVLKKSGLGKSSNILLFALAIADAFCLLGALNIGFILHIVSGRGTSEMHPYWKFSYAASYVFYIIFMFCNFSTSIGGRVSTYITVLITVERFIALYFPLRFPSIVTPKRVWLAIGIVVVMWLPWSCFQMAWFGFEYVYLPQFNTSAGNYVGTEVFLSVGVDLVQIVSTHLSHLIPFIIVTAGSVIISLKIGITLRKRRELTHGSSETKASTTRTNRMLLMICLVFSVTRSVYYLQYLYWLDGVDPLWTYLYTIYAILRQFLVYLNSAVNFFIYVGLNKKFRKTFEDLWCFSKMSRPSIRSADAN